MKTNPEYAKLAYRKTILTETVALLRRNFVPDDVTEQPLRTLVCEDVFQVDAVVPVEGFADFVEELEEQIKSLGHEMKQFELRKRTDEPATKQAPKARAEESKPAPKVRKGKAAA